MRAGPIKDDQVIRSCFHLEMGEGHFDIEQRGDSECPGAHLVAAVIGVGIVGRSQSCKAIWISDCPIDLAAAAVQS